MAPQIVEVPKWIIALRAAQIVLAVIILGMSCYGVYWIHFNAWGFAIFTSLVTIIAVAYTILASDLPAFKQAYNHWVILGLNCAGAIFWLSCMASLAATRAAFRFPTTIDECVNDGSGGVCVKRRDLSKRGYVATYPYLNMMSAAAGLSAIEMLLCIATLVIFATSLQRQRRSTNLEAATPHHKQEMNPISAGQQYQPVNQQQMYTQPQPYVSPVSQAQPYSAPQHHQYQ